MKKQAIGFILLLTLGFMSAGYSANEVTLRYGANEVVVRVMNDCNAELQSLALSIDDERIPAGISASITSKALDVPARKKSVDGLYLTIDVAQSVAAGRYDIPITLKDQTGNAWQFSLDADVVLDLPAKFALHHNFPNPFNPSTHIEYALANTKAQPTQLVVFDVLGRRVRTLVNRNQMGGNYSVVWDGRDEYGAAVSSGIYYCKLTSGSFVQLQKMTLMK